MELSPGWPGAEHAPRAELIDRWSVALERGDGAEVDRIVRLSRIERLAGASAGRLGPMLG